MPPPSLRLRSLSVSSLFLHFFKDIFDRLSHVYKYLQASKSCRTFYNLDCFKILDSAPTRYQVKLKESMYIKWEKPDLNQQVKHISLTLSLQMHARASVNFVNFQFMQHIVFQRKVTYTVHCNRHVLTATLTMMDVPSKHVY